jgi:hypothetical protein
MRRDCAMAVTIPPPLRNPQYAARALVCPTTQAFQRRATGASAATPDWADPIGALPRTPRAGVDYRGRSPACYLLMTDVAGRGLVIGSA